MSPRERWIVYPLIFLTLGIALRDKLLYQVKTNEVEAQRVACGQVKTNDIEAQRVACSQLVADQLVVKQTSHLHLVECQTLVVHAPTGKTVAVLGADADTNNGLIETFSSRGVPQVRIQSNEDSGVVTALDPTGKTVTLGCIGKVPGVFAYLPDQKILVPLTLQVEFKPNGKASQPKDAKKPAEPSPPPPKTLTPKTPMPKSPAPKKTAEGA